MSKQPQRVTLHIECFRRKNMLSKVPQALCFLMLIHIRRFSPAACVSFAPQSFLICTSAYRLRGWKALLRLSCSRVYRKQQSRICSKQVILKISSSRYAHSDWLPFEADFTNQKATELQQSVVWILNPFGFHWGFWHKSKNHQCQ